MRPTGLASPVDKDRQDFTIYSGAWAVGRIYEQHGGLKGGPAPRREDRRITALVVAYAALGGHSAAPHAAPYRGSRPQHLTLLASWQVLRRPTRLLVLQGRTPFDARSFRL